MKRIFFCQRCKTQMFRNAKHDAYFCSRCDRWAEEICEDEKCEFCVGRPVRPSQARVVIDCSAA